MRFIIPFHPRFFSDLKNYSLDQFRHDFSASINVMVLAFPLSMAFAIASGVKPVQGLYTAIIGGGIIALLGGSRVQIGGPTGAFVIITYSIVQSFGLNGLFVCTMMAGAMLCMMGFSKMGSIIRFIPYPVSRAFTKGIAVLIISSQIINFLGLREVKLPVEFVDKIHLLVMNFNGIHWPTACLSMITTILIIGWPTSFSRYISGSMAVLIVMTALFGVLGLDERWQIATIGSEFGAFSSSLPSFQVPSADWGMIKQLIQPAFTIAILVAMQALLSAVVTDGLLDDRHDSNQELLGQGLANMVGPLFGCLPVTAGVARSVTNVRSGAQTPVSGLLHSLLIFLLLLITAPLIVHIPLATLSAVLVFAAYRMVEWKQFARLRSWPVSDSLIFLVTFSLTVLTNLTLAVEVGVVLASLLMMKRILETSQITAVDESAETEGSHHSLVGKTIPEGVLIFRVFGALFFGVVDKLSDELKSAKQEPEVLILRVRKVLAIDATGLQALDDLLIKLTSKGKKMILSAPHSQPLQVMIKSGFIDRLGRENVCADIDASLTRARVILGLSSLETDSRKLK
jgi:SulP family sulfate permease